MTTNEKWLERQLDVARQLIDVGGRALRQGDLVGAEANFDEASAVLDMATEQTDDVLTVRAQVLNERGFLFQRTDRPAEALAAHEEGRDICDELLGRGVEFRANAAATHINMAGLLAARNDLASARRENEQAIALVEELLEDEGSTGQARNLAFGAHHNLAIVLARSGDLAGADEAMERSVELARELAADEPASWAQAAQACQQISVVMFNEKDFDRALRWGRVAEEFSEKAHQALGDQALSIYVTSEVNLISYHEKAGNFAEAEDCLWKALDVVGDHPEVLERGAAFYENCRKQADARVENGGLPRAEVDEGYAELQERIDAAGGLED